MNEKTYRRIILGLSVALVGTIVWLGLLYKNGGDTRTALATAESELDAAIAGNTSLAEELAGANKVNNGLIEEQRESSSYQREIEAELELANKIIGELATATEDLADGISRVDNLTGEYAELIRQGNEFIENGKE